MGKQKLLRIPSSNFRGIADLGLHLYIKHGQLQVNGIGKTTYTQHRSPRGIQTGAGGYVERAAGRLAMMDTVSGVGQTGGLVTLPAPGLVVENSRANLAQTLGTVTVSGAGAASYSADATVLKPGGGSSNKVTVTEGGATKNLVVLWSGSANANFAVSGEKHTVIFRAMASAALDVNVLVRATAIPNITVGTAGSDTKTISLTTSWQTFVITLTLNAAIDDSLEGFLCFDVGGTAGAYNVWFSGNTLHNCDYPFSPQEYDPGSTAANHDSAYTIDTSNQIRFDEGTLLVRGYVPFWLLGGYYVAPTAAIVATINAISPTAPANNVNFAQIRRLNQTQMRYCLNYGAHAFWGRVLSTTAPLQNKYNNLAYSWKNLSQAAALNGVIVGTAADDLTDIASKYVNPANLTMGGIQAGTAQSGDGCYLEGADNGVFSFNRALSQSELIALTTRNNVF